MLPWTEIIGDAPAFVLESLDTLPDDRGVVDRIRAGHHVKAVALVGYRDDAEASEAARRLPYGYQGAGIEEIVFVRTGLPAPLGSLTFEDDAWPGQDQVYVQDDLDAGLEQVHRFAIEYGAATAIVLVTGHAAFVATIADKLCEC